MLNKDTVSAERPHIVFFGLRNAGKSSVVNAVTGQELSIVSDVAGTTTDPVRKAMEMLPLGPVVIIDTPGVDDEGELGEIRVKRAMRTLDSADAAVLVVDSSRGFSNADRELCGLFAKKNIPFIIAMNKSDLVSDAVCEAAPERTCEETADSVKSTPERACEEAADGVKSVPERACEEAADSVKSTPERACEETAAGVKSVPERACEKAADSVKSTPERACEEAADGVNASVGNANLARGVDALVEEAFQKAAVVLRVSAVTGEGIHELKERLARIIGDADSSKKLIADLVAPGDVVVLVVPIDAAAPKGRLILPQQQTIRELLENGSIPVVCRESELQSALSSLSKRPAMVVTDSQAFGKVSADTPSEIPMTSFSILFARYKGSLAESLRGFRALKNLKDGDRVLISEGCTHHRQCGDIGTVKLPAWIRKFTGHEPSFEFTSGRDFPEDPEKYSLVIHCGGCMLGEREMRSRVRHCEEAGVPITNYGIAIAGMHGILERATAVFPEVSGLL